ncbi:MAG: hypothetical protein HQ581_05830, partial [Planctomycetes bacterium]|nr:hypothetical protein [Planctomycetota bacterium]
TGQCGAGCQKACCRPCIRFFGEFLLLRPGNDKVSFAVPINSGIVPPAGAAPVQIGPEGIVDCDFEGGFRLGFAFRLDSCSELGLTYSHFEADTTNAISNGAPYVLRSLVSHPGAVAAPTDFLNASARYDIDFQIVDLDYRRVLSRGNRYSLNYVLGLRYAHLGQIFDARFTNATTIETVSTEIRFDGGGIRFGLEGDRKIGDCGFLVYSRAAASLLGGNFRGRYVQSDNFRGTVANTGWSEDGVISILDLELGVGWTSRGGCVRLTTGYLFSGWFNALATDEFIQGVQTNNSVAVGDTLTFDGLSIRTEIRF